MEYPGEHHVFLFLIQLLLLLGLARGLGEVFRRWRQPPLTAEILVGIFLGPTILGRYFPDLFTWLFPMDTIQVSMLETVAWLGVLFLLLETGLEIDFAGARRQRAEAVKIALADICSHRVWRHFFLRHTRAMDAGFSAKAPGSQHAGVLLRARYY